MNVTFFIGNGFDLSLNYKTRFIDFFEFLQNNKIRNSLISSIVKNNKTIQYWSDFEKVLCMDYCSTIMPEQEESFVKDLVEFKKMFSVYLKDQHMEEDLVSYTSNGKRIANIAYNSLFCFEDCLCDLHKNIISPYIRDKSFNINIINFNYTYSLYRITKNCIKANQHFGNDFLNPIINVHGTIFDSLILGVGDESLICNKRLLKNDEVKPLLVKPFYNDILGNNTNDKVCSIIDDSNLIIIFGMSLGISDSNWWKAILKKGFDSNIPILYFAYHEIDELEKHMYERFRNDIKRKFTNVTDANDREKQYIDKLFIVDMQKQLFNFYPAKI